MDCWRRLGRFGVAPGGLLGDSGALPALPGHLSRRSWRLLGRSLRGPGASDSALGPLRHRFWGGFWPPSAAFWKVCHKMIAEVSYMKTHWAMGLQEFAHALGKLLASWKPFRGSSIIIRFVWCDLLVHVLGHYEKRTDVRAPARQKKV